MTWCIVSLLAALLAAASGAAGLGGANAWPVAAYPLPAYTPYTQDYEEDLYYLPKPVVRYPYYAPVSSYEPEPYRSSYPIYYKPLPYPDLEDPVRLEERAAREAALPVGQETWYESDPPVPRWRQAGYDDVNAAFLQNLIITQMARNAENRARAAAEPQHSSDHENINDDDDTYGERGISDLEDEDVRELKALAGKPLYHSAKTELHDAVPTNQYGGGDYYDYPSDDGFINWDSKRSDRASERQAAVVTQATSTVQPEMAAGQQEFVMLRPATPVRHPFSEPVMQMLKSDWHQEKRSRSVYDKIKKMLAADTKDPNAKVGSSDKGSRLKKRYISSDDGLVTELRGLKRRIAT